MENKKEVKHFEAMMSRPIHKSERDNVLQVKSASVGLLLECKQPTDILNESSDIGTGIEPLVIFVHNNRHLYGLIGTINIDGEILFQMIHGSSSVWLVSREQLEKAHFDEAWCFRQSARDIPISVGASEIIFDKLHHNFGEIKPDRDLSCTFTLHNTSTSQKTIILGVPSTSCVCTIPSLKENTRLATGEKRTIDIELQTGISTSTRQTIEIKCYEEGTGKQVNIPLEIFGNQRRSMEISPKSLDFGIINLDKKTSRMVSIKEVPTDRFKISKIDVGDLPLVAQMVNEPLNNGLNLYRMTFDLLIRDSSQPFATSGMHKGEITISTDSRQYPKVALPIVYEVPSSVRVIPNIVSFGVINLGEKAETEVEFIARDAQKVSVVFETVPDDVVLSMNDTTNSTKMIVQLTATKQGIWEGFVCLKIISGGVEEVVKLKCVAYVRSP